MLLLVAAACGGGQAALGSGVVVGAVGAREAIDAFLATVKKKDIQAMSLVWGTQNGPVREQMERNQMEKRELLLVCYLKHDSFRVVDDSRGENGRIVFKVELTQGQLKRATNFTAVKGPNERWFLEDVDITLMQDFCTGR